MPTKTGICQLRKHPDGWDPIVTNWHHILPLAMGGPDIWANKIEICPLCHYNTHALMWMMANGKTLPSGHLKEKALAKRALDEWDGTTGPVPFGAVNPSHLQEEEYEVKFS